MASFSIATIWWQTQGQHWLKHGVCVCVCVCARVCACLCMCVGRGGVRVCVWMGVRIALNKCVRQQTCKNEEACEAANSLLQGCGGAFVPGYSKVQTMNAVVRRVGQKRVCYIYSVYRRMAKNTVYTPNAYGSGQPVCINGISCRRNFYKFTVVYGVCIHGFDQP